MGCAALSAMPLAAYLVYLNYQSLQRLLSESSGGFGFFVIGLHCIAFASVFVGVYFANKRNEHLKALLAFLVLPAIGAIAGLFAGGASYW